jgi:hypothetical protein
MAIILPNAASTPVSLDGVRSKITRAQHHFADIHVRIEATLGTKNDGETIPGAYEIDADRQQLVMKLPKVKPLDPLLPLVVGDCVHNLRSALDHLVFQLAMLNGAGSVAATKTSFPVCLTRKEFKNSVKGNVRPFISRVALTEIEKCQPYKTTNLPDTDIIWQLSQLDIIDKHRVLIVVLQQFRPIGFELTVPTGDKFSHAVTESDWKPSKDGAEIVRFDLSHAITRPGKVNVKVQTAATVQFSNTGLVCDGRIVEHVLQQCGTAVESIVNTFGKRFFGE